MTLTYDADRNGSSADFPASITLGTGGTMRFRGGDGASVPKFDVSATIPGLAVPKSPVPATPGGAAIIDSSQDLSVTWLPISFGQIHFWLQLAVAPFQQGSPLPATILVTCTFDGASGSGVVPNALLSSLKEMSDAGRAYASLTSTLEATTVVDGLTIVTQGYHLPPTTESSVNATLQ